MFMPKQLAACLVAALLLVYCALGLAANPETEARWRYPYCPDGVCKTKGPYAYYPTIWKRWPGAAEGDQKAEDARDKLTPRVAPPKEPVETPPTEENVPKHLIPPSEDEETDEDAMPLLPGADEIPLPTPDKTQPLPGNGLPNPFEDDAPPDEGKLDEQSDAELTSAALPVDDETCRPTEGSPLADDAGKTYVEALRKPAQPPLPDHVEPAPTLARTDKKRKPAQVPTPAKAASNAARQQPAPLATPNAKLLKSERSEDSVKRRQPPAMSQGPSSRRSAAATNGTAATELQRFLPEDPEETTEIRRVTHVERIKPVEHNRPQVTTEPGSRNPLRGGMSEGGSPLAHSDWVEATDALAKPIAPASTANPLRSK